MYAESLVYGPVAGSGEVLFCLLDSYLRSFLSLNNKNVVAAIIGLYPMADKVVEVILVNRVSLAVEVGY